MSQLLTHYNNETIDWGNVESGKKLKHKTQAEMIYKSIRNIIKKSIQVLSNKITQLGIDDEQN